MKGTVQVSDTHLQASCMARVRSAQQVRRAVAIGVLFYSWYKWGAGFSAGSSSYGYSPTVFCAAWYTGLHSH